MKFQLFEGKKLNQIATGLVDGIGLPACRFSFKSKQKNLGLPCKTKDHDSAIKLALETLLKTKTIKKLNEISVVGHRVVHGGEKYIKPTILNSKIIKELTALATLAPLHAKANLTGILAIKKILPKTKQVAVFDTAFYADMPDHAKIYAIPTIYFEKHGIRRYGFHGINHKHVVNEALKILKNKKAKIVSCHLGNGSSITASIGGKAVDTSMGFTPLEGLPMGTRSGSIDPSIIFYLKDKLKMDLKKIEHMLNFESGLKGLSGISSDMRDIYAAAGKGDEKAKLTIEILSYDIAKYIGAYAAALSGLDAIVFTGGLGEKASYVREKAISRLTHLKNPRPRILIIPANEGLEIAGETMGIG